MPVSTECAGALLSFRYPSYYYYYLTLSIDYEQSLLVRQGLSLKQNC